MKGSREFVCTVLFLTLVNFACSEVYYNFVIRDDPCIMLCEQMMLNGPDTKYVRSCCQRGCRFFNLVGVRYGLVLDGLNGTYNACQNSCTEAYTESRDRDVCNMGCHFMEKQRISDLLSLYSMAISVEEGVDSSILLMPPDIPENDILSDPGLRKELFPGWWDSNGFKLPQTYIKTVPLDSGTVDYGIPSDYSGENEQSVPAPRTIFFQWASINSYIRCCVFAFAFVFASSALAAFFIPCFSWEKTVDPAKEPLTEDSYIKCDICISDKPPYHEKPPPKYSNVVNVGEISLMV